MSYDRPSPPFGTDSSLGGGSSSYFSYGAPKSLPVAAGAFNGGLLNSRATSNAAYGQQKQPYNPISWRPSNSSSISSSILPPIHPDSTRSAAASTTTSAFYALNNPSQSPAATAAANLAPVQVVNPIVNLNSDAASRVRSATQGVHSMSSYNPTSYNTQPTPPAANTKFHRTRSSFIPNKWTRGPGDGTFGSVYLSYGGSEFGGRTFGGGPNLSFDRKRPEELWEEEQARKRALANGGNTSSNTGKKKKSSTRKGKKDKKPANSKEAQARKLLARARNQLLAHLSAPSCRLFSEADHVVAVSDDDLDDLLRAGGGDASKVLAHLTEFDRANRKFDSFAELMDGIKEARKAHGDFGAGTEEEPNYDDQGQAAQGDEQQADGAAAADGQQAEDSQNAENNNGGESYRSEDFVQEPAAEQSQEEVKSSTTGGKSKKATGGKSSGRGPTIAEKRAAAQAEADAKKRAEEQAKRNNVAKASAARAAEAKRKKDEEAKEPSSSTKKSSSNTPKRASTTSTKPEEEKKEAEAAPAESAEADAPAAAEESYGDDFDSA